MAQSSSTYRSVAARRPPARSIFPFPLLAACASSALAADPEVAKPRVVGIDWPSGGTISVSGSAGERLKGVDHTLLPVLVPKPFLGFKSLVFVGEPLQYTASIKDGDASIAITGTRIAIDAGDDTAPGDTGTIQIALREKSAEAWINRYGAAYLVTVDCARASDRRCKSTDYAANLLRSVELVGGGKDGTAAPPVPQTPPVPGVISVSSDPDFAAEPAGDLLPRSGTGVHSATIYAPGIRFPVSVKPVYLNSQVWNIGGNFGPKGGWSDRRNYKYPWRDNFCEKRQWKTPMCPGGSGHQGVDIRPSKPTNDDGQMGVAVENGRISFVGSYKITLAGDSGTHYNYLHMRNVRVKPGDRVTAGQALGRISNNFGSTSTTYHLHFEIQQNRNGKGWMHVPPYSSLVAAYERF